MSIRRDTAPTRRRTRPEATPWTPAATTCSVSSPSDAALERSDFLVQSTDQLRRFLDRHKERIAAIGGLTLIDEEPDYLSIAPDLSFRSRSRFQDELTGEWVSETEVIETAAELVELYNPADIYAAFAEAAKEAAGLGRRADRQRRPDGRRRASRPRRRSRSARTRTPPPPTRGPPASRRRSRSSDDETAARRLYDLALEYQERSQRSEARLLDEFEAAAASAAALVGDLVIVDDDDERLVLTATGAFRAEVVPEEADGEWRTLVRPGGARRVLRPDRRLRRPGRRARRGLPGRVARLRGRRRRGRRRATRSRTATTTAEDAERRRRRRRGRRRGRGGPSDRVTMRLAAAELVESREILPGQWLQAYHAPDLATGSRAGQFVHVRTGDFSGMVLRRPFSLNTTDAGDRHRDHPLPGHRPRDRVVHAAAPGRRGRPARPARADRSRSIRAAGTCCSSPAGWAWPASGCSPTRRIRDGRQVTLLFGAASSREVYPSSLLPDEVEYVVATDDGSLGHHGYVTDLVPDYEAWADQAFACGPTGMLAALARQAAGRRQRLGVADARPQARRRQAGPARLDRGPAQGLPAGVDGAEHGLRRRAPAWAAWSWPRAGRRSGSAARARSSPPRSSSGRAPGREGQAQGRDLRVDRAGARAAGDPPRRSRPRRRPRRVRATASTPGHRGRRAGRRADPAGERRPVGRPGPRPRPAQPDPRRVGHVRLRHRVRRRRRRRPARRDLLQGHDAQGRASATRPRA